MHDIGYDMVYAVYNLPELLRESKCLVVEVPNWVEEAYQQPWSRNNDYEITKQ